MTEGFEAFWEASRLSPTTIRAFGQRVDRFGDAGWPDELSYPSAPVPLPRPRDRMARLLARRRSERAFGAGSISTRQLGSLLAAFAGGGGRRAFPSAGALYPVEVFCLANAVAEPGLDGRVLHYDHASHGLCPVRPLPPWAEYGDLLNLPVDGAPQLVVVFVLMAERMLAKYGERGGRFALVEVGHAAQNLALRVVQEGLAGCEAGGALDREILALLGLEGTAARAALAYAVGRPDQAKRRIDSAPATRQ